MSYKEEYKKWLSAVNPEEKAELEALNESEIEDSFYRDLEFGTGGLSGVMGPGTNRMNVYIVR